MEDLIGGMFIVQEETWQERLIRTFKGKPKKEPATGSNRAPKPEGQSTLRRRFTRAPSQENTNENPAHDSDDEFAHLTIPELHAKIDELKRKIAADQARSASEDVLPPLPPRPNQSAAGLCTKLQSVFPVICGMAPLSPDAGSITVTDGSLSSTALFAQPVDGNDIANTIAVLPTPSMVSSHVLGANQRESVTAIHI